MLAYDADAAGAAGANRVYDLGTPAPDGRGGRSASLKEAIRGSSPEPIPTLCAVAIVDAKPFLAFRLARIFGSADLSSIEGRAKTADLALGAVLEHPSELVRDQYLMEVADRCRMEPAALRSRWKNWPSRVEVPSIKVTAIAVVRRHRQIPRFGDHTFRGIRRVDDDDDP